MKQHQNNDSGHSQDHGSTPNPCCKHRMNMCNYKMATCHQTKWNNNGKTRKRETRGRQ